MHGVYDHYNQCAVEQVYEWSSKVGVRGAEEQAVHVWFTCTIWMKGKGEAQQRADPHIMLFYLELLHLVCLHRLVRI